MKARNAFLLIFSVLTPLSLAQDDSFSLFEPTEQPESRQEVRQAERATPQSTEPAFTLRGTARLGDNYSATLVSRDGQPVTMNWKPGSRSQVGSYAGFSVVGIQGRTVSLEIPADERCVESKAKGVSCSSSGMALLTLATATPLPPREPQQSQDAFAQAVAESSGDVEVIEGEVAEGLPLNPFSGEPQVPVQISEEERQSRAARQAARMRALQNFQPVRIPDDQVPPGMRKVETPFGDRLVQDDG